jgi:hypothetical protein
MEKRNYTLKKAAYSFGCPVCGTRVNRGDNYIDEDGVATCLCTLPSRRLKPLRDIIDADTEKALKHLRLENLKMRLDFEVIIDHPNGKAAKKILDKYRRLRKVREEKFLSVQN